MSRAILLAAFWLAVLAAAPARADDMPRTGTDDGRSAHEAAFAESRYPSAQTCGGCHPRHYREWSVSQHAYAQLSPVYLAQSNFLNKATGGSTGDFCFRCHSAVGAALGEPPFISNLERDPISREGVTCVVCHRISKRYDKVSGRFALDEGGITAPVKGPSGNAELKRIIDSGDYKVETDPAQPGRKIHADVKLFETLSAPSFCGQCHDVTLPSGFRLEEAYSEYRTSPAAAKGVTCQDCHMASEPGRPSPYLRGPAATVGGVDTKDRKLTSHLFAGPDHSVIHPGIFPHNPEAQRFATIEQWLQFDVAAGWGTAAFEARVESGEIAPAFPAFWADRYDREDARALLDGQLELLEQARQSRLALLRAGYRLGEVVPEATRAGLRFRVQVRNGTDGHNVPTGLIAERLVWLHVAVRDAAGAVVFESGDLDPNGDLRDVRSAYVDAGLLPRDRQLFSLQSHFLVTSVRGGERERVVPVPFSTSALPVVRPSTRSSVLTGQPANARDHRHGIEPDGERWARYRVDAGALTGKPPYTATVALKAGMVPVHFIAAIQSVGFDYGLSPRAVGDAVVAGHEVLWSKTFVLPEGR
jgi:hypothetical protein